MMKCPMCFSFASKAMLVNPKDLKRYFDCSSCHLVFLDRSQCLSAEEEKARYLTHNNDIDDPKYQKFVSDITDYVSDYIPTTALGLDFGAGTGPVIAKVLGEKKYQVNLFDPYFHNDDEVLKLNYDFIISCEVVEHFNYPEKEFRLLNGMLKDKSVLIIKTDVFLEKINFATWYYRKDPTHISFYRLQTMHWIKEHYGFKNFLNLNDRTVVFIK